MPELPEVEVARLCLERWARRRRVRRVRVHDRRVVDRRGGALPSIEGARFERFERQGKNLLLTLQRADGARVGLWSHLGMTGKWAVRALGAERPRFARVEIALDDGRVLHYVDMRLFGRLRLVPDADFRAVAEVAALGPDPLRDGIDRARLREALGRGRQPVKLALMDQRVLAGIGNIQASEALFRARLDPRRPAGSLDGREVARLASAVRASIDHTLARADVHRLLRGGGEVEYVEEPGSANPFLVYGRAGEPCPRCRRGTIARIVQGGRATYLCPRCQGVEATIASRRRGRAPDQARRAPRA